MPDVTIADLLATGSAARTDQIETDDGTNSRRRTVAQVLGLATIADVAGLQGALDGKAAIGASAAAPIVSASPTATYQATGLTGGTVIKLALGGNTTISAPTVTGLAANSVYGVRYELTATGADRTPSFSGFVLGGGVNPARTIASGGLLFVDTEIHTDGSGAVALHRLVGVYDPAGEPDATINPAADFLAFSDADDAGRPKRVRGDALRDMPGRPFTVRIDIPAPTARTDRILLENVSIGTIIAAIAYTDTGSVTANVQIADKTGAADWTATNAASITGLSAIAVTTTPARSTASGANTMAKTGTTDRILQVVMTSPSGTPGNLTLELECLS
ncbi:hypothetical protein [Elioraea sp.]|uniref:hypothetical protein n=1 Tax=Elioraea sp. TaxID=2185103 RepID=UPI0025BED7D6|nr:hypothetical protein [Elioraea sp.]